MKHTRFSLISIQLTWNLRSLVQDFGENDLFLVYEETNQ